MTAAVAEEAQLDSDCREMWLIVMRRQQLLSRQAILLEMQKILKTSLTARGEEEKEEDEGPSELERIEKELQSLSERERQLVNKRSSWEKQTIIMETIEESSDTDPDATTAVNRKNLIISGVCVLPNGPASQNLTTTGQSPESSEEVQEHLAFSPATVHCPTCQKHVTTEIHYKVGRSSFILCFFSILLCCVAGCCLLPFFLNYFKDVSHRCPSCHAEIQTVHRF